MPDRKLIKSPEAIASMRRAGRILGQTLTTVCAAAKPGITGLELDALARKTIETAGGEPAFLGYQDFPATICFSVNDGLVHGIPTPYAVKPGDVVKIDIGVRVDGYNVDAARTVLVPPVDPKDQALVDATTEALEAGIAQVKDGVHLGTVQAAIQSVIKRHGYGLVRSLTGHGIGTELHEPPQIPNYGEAGSGPLLKAGMTICLEPMLTAGSGEVGTGPDGWTVVSKDGTQSAHVEETLLITEHGAEVLTKAS